MSHHLIFEGAELAGKSWIMSQVYNYLEDKFGTNADVLDGCHWFNSDIGVYGSKHGQPIINHYIDIFEEIKEHNIIVEKFHISDIVYNKLYRQKEIDYSKELRRLRNQNFKIIFIKFPESISVLESRIKDRLNLYPHYKKILKESSWYIDQQKLYQIEIEKSGLDYLEIRTNTLPDQSIIKKIINWI